MSRLAAGRRKSAFRALSNLTTGGRPILTIRTNGAGGRGQSGVRRVEARNRQPIYIGRFDEVLSFLEASMSAQAGKMHVSFAGKMH